MREELKNKINRLICRKYLKTYQLRYSQIKDIINIFKLKDPVIDTTNSIIVRYISDFIRLDLDNIPTRLQSIKNLTHSDKQSLYAYQLKFGDIEGVEKYNSMISKISSHSKKDYQIAKFGIEKYKDISFRKSVNFRDPAKQKELSHRFKQKKIDNPDMYKDYLPNQRGYWIKKGFNMCEAIQKVKERQSTFSLGKCIDSHGEIEGLKVFNNRQMEWQETLNNKSQEEIDRINRSKSTLTNPWFNLIHKNKEYQSKKGIVYYLRFYDNYVNPSIEFFKIGITKLSLDDRFLDYQNLYRKHKLNYNIIHIQEMNTIDCLSMENKILKKYKSSRIKIDFNGFKTTEAFSTDIVRSTDFINIIKDFNA